MVMRLRAKLILPILLAVVAGLAVLTVISDRNTSAALEQAYRQTLEELAESLEIQTREWLRQRMSDITLMAASPLSQDALAANASRETIEEATRALLRMRHVTGVFTTVALSDARGTARVHTDTSQIGQLDVSQRGFFQEAMRGETVLSDVVISAISGNPVLVSAAPVYQDFSIAGIAYGGAELDRFTEVHIDGVQIGTTGFIYIIDEQGRIISHPDRSRIMQENVRETDHGRRMMELRTGFLEYDLEGTGYLAAFREIPENQWIVVAQAAREDILSPITTLRVQNTIAGAVVLVVLGVLVYLLAGMIIRRVDATVTRLRDISQGEGDLTQRLPVTGQDELNDLARHLNATLENLGSMVAAIKDETGSLDRSGVTWRYT